MVVSVNSTGHTIPVMIKLEEQAKKHVPFLALLQYLFKLIV
jgi:hypothetical protein